MCLTAGQQPALCFLPTKLPLPEHTGIAPGFKTYSAGRMLKELQLCSADSVSLQEQAVLPACIL